jgi:hypothetical protein
MWRSATKEYLMSSVINLFAPDILQRRICSKPPLSEEAREEASKLGWNNRFCEKCGRPYSQPPTVYSIEEITEDPLWLEWQHTINCREGNCEGIYLIHGFTPVLVTATRSSNKRTLQETGSPTAAPGDGAGHE